jgi:hypothetical protein
MRFGPVAPRRIRINLTIRCVGVVIAIDLCCIDSRPDGTTFCGMATLFEIYKPFQAFKLKWAGDTIAKVQGKSLGRYFARILFLMKRIS